MSPIKRCPASVTARVLFCIALLPTLCYCQGNTTDTSTDNCYRNCTGSPIEPFCATNGVTYNNRCEMYVAACRLQRDDIAKQSNGPCVVPTISETFMKGLTCEQHREHTLNRKRNDLETWRRECNVTALKEKAAAGELTINDLSHCYRPSCVQEIYYTPRQCYSLSSRSKWCWCSGPTGLNIEGTLSSGLDPNYCSMRNTCQYQGANYSDGEVFKPDHGCGICECLDGNVTCFEDFVPDTSGRLNASQMNQLSDLLVQFFYFENYRKESILYDIRKISTIIQDIPLDVQIPILDGWFDHYDSDGNGLLEYDHQEETAFHQHISQFTFCKQFLSHVSEAIDADGNGSATRLEWRGFFTTQTPPTAADEGVPDISKRSAPKVRRHRRSVENRERFFYVVTS